MLTQAQLPFCISTLSVFYNSRPQTFQDNDPSTNLKITYGPSVTFRTDHSIENTILLLHTAPCAVAGELAEQQVKVSAFQIKHQCWNRSSASRSSGFFIHHSFTKSISRLFSVNQLCSINLIIFNKKDHLSVWHGLIRGMG